MGSYIPRPRKDPLTIGRVCVSKSLLHFEKLCSKLLCVSLITWFGFFNWKRDRERITADKFQVNREMCYTHLENVGRHQKSQSLVWFTWVWERMEIFPNYLNCLGLHNWLRTITKQHFSVISCFPQAWWCSIPVLNPRKWIWRQTQACLRNSHNCINLYYSKHLNMFGLGISG